MLLLANAIDRISNVIWQTLYIVYYRRFLSSNVKQLSDLALIAILEKIVSTWALFSTVATGINRFAREFNTYGGAPFLLEPLRSADRSNKISRPTERRPEVGGNNIETGSRHPAFYTTEISALEAKFDADSSSSQRGIVRGQTLEQCSEEGSIRELAEIQGQHTKAQDRWSVIG